MEKKNPNLKKRKQFKPNVDNIKRQVSKPMKFGENKN